MHRTNTSQNSWQLILPDVCDPFCDSILDNFVNTEETITSEKKKRLAGNAFTFVTSLQTINLRFLICAKHSSDNQQNGYCGEKHVKVYPCLQHSLFSFNSEQFNWASPIRIPANVPCVTRKRTKHDYIHILDSYLSITASLQIFEQVLLCEWSHLFNDHMFAVIVQPDRHFRGKAELPKNSSKDKCHAFSQLTQPLNQLYGPSLSFNSSSIPEIDWLFRGGGRAGRGWTLLAVGCFHRGCEVRPQTSSRVCFFRYLLWGVCLHWKWKSM